MSPVFQNVAPGDLITADYFNQLLNEVNWLIDTVTQLNARVTALEAGEAGEGSPPKGKESKEGKEGKEKLESKEHKIEGKELIKDFEKSAVVDKGTEKTFEKGLEKTFEKALEKGVEKITEKGLEKQFEKGLEKLRDFKTTDALADLRAAGDGSAFPDAATTADATPVRHFIPAELRPDLVTSALRGEPDLNGGDSGSASSVPPDSGSAAAEPLSAEPVSAGTTEGGSG